MTPIGGKAEGCTVQARGGGGALHGTKGDQSGGCGSEKGGLGRLAQDVGIVEGCGQPSMRC